MDWDNFSSQIPKVVKKEPVKEQKLTNLHEQKIISSHKSYYIPFCNL